MSRRAVAVFAFLPWLLVSPASAQYMYLDADGDGVHTDQDLMPTSGGLDVDIWLVTNGNRAGDLVTCRSDPESLTINSYVLNLHAVGGTVHYGAFQNRMPTFDIALHSGQDSTDWENGAAGMYPLASDRYRLGTLHIEVVSGAPQIDIVPESHFRVDVTSFGSRCGGQDFDNTLKLGSDWFDADGLDSPDSGAAPGFEPIDDLSLDENTTATRHVAASDADGETLTLALQGLPWFASASSPVQGQGRVDADITFAPDFRSAGSYSTSAVVSDGLHSRQMSFSVTVLNVNRPPAMDPVPDVAVEIGATLLVPIHAYDPDYGSYPLALTLADGPPFASLAGTSVELHPGVADAGVYTLRVAASDGQIALATTFQVTVTDNGQHGPPVFEPVADVSLDEKEFDWVRVVAHASTSGERVSLRLLEAPSYVHMDTSPNYDPTLAYGNVSIYPSARDSGTAAVRIEASSGLHTATLEFWVHVRDKAFPPTLIDDVGCVEPGATGRAYFIVRAEDLDSVVVSCGPLPAWASVGDAGSVSSDRLYLVLRPGPEEPPIDFGITVYVNRGAADEVSWPVTLTISPYDECVGSGGGFIEGEDPSVPDAGGPYSGVAGAAVVLHAASTPPAAETAYRWTFGDGHAATGSSAAHAYLEGGTYRAIVRVSNYPVSRDSANVVIADAYPARALLDGHPAPLQLSRKTDLWFTLEQASDAYDLADLDPASLWLRVMRGGAADSIRASGKGSLAAESSGAGGTRVRGCFAQADLDRLFAGVRGRLTVEARVQGRLLNGARVRAPITLTIVGRPGDRGRVVVWPNPLNPAGTLSFETERAGRVSVRIYDVAGRLVRTLWDAALEAGPVDLPFDGRNDHGGALGSGVYYYRINAPDRAWSGRITVLK
jgi:hypothetical protein